MLLLLRVSSISTRREDANRECLQHHLREVLNHGAPAEGQHQLAGGGGGGE